MVFEAVNLLAVLVGAVISLVVGTLWYSPMLFGNQWMKSMGWSKKDVEKMKKDPKGKAKMMKSYFGMFIGSLVMSFVLAMFVDYAGATTLATGAFVGVIAAIGFVVTSKLSDYLFEGRSQEGLLIGSGYYVVTLAIIGAVLTAM